MKYIALIFIILVVFLYNMPKEYSYCILKIDKSDIPFRNDMQKYNQYTKE